jgi:hypothetical protein
LQELKTSRLPNDTPHSDSATAWFAYTSRTIRYLLGETLFGEVDVPFPDAEVHPFYDDIKRQVVALIIVRGYIIHAAHLAKDARDVSDWHSFTYPPIVKGDGDLVKAAVINLDEALKLLRTTSQNVDSHELCVSKFRELAELWTSCVDPFEKRLPEAFQSLQLTLEDFYKSSGLEKNFKLVRERDERLERDGKYRGRHRVYKEIETQV